MRKIETLRELQLVNIKIYKDLFDFCKNNNLQIYLLGGSLIGAVRHKGFIPWDDDLDVCMSRLDYEKMLQISAGKISDKCSILDPATNENFKGYIALASYDNSKLISKQYKEEEQGKISVSIFVYDGVPDNRLTRFLYYVRMYILRSKHALCRADFHHVSSKLARVVGPFLSNFYKKDDVYLYKKRILELENKYSYQNSRYVSANTDTNAWREVFEKEKFETPVYLEFEGMKVKTFCYYDEHLRKYYGNYMTLPPEQYRVAKHSFNAWIEDTFDFTEVKDE